MFLEWNDEKYSKRLSKRILNGIDTCVENGTYTGCKLIFGYKFIDTDRKGKKGTLHKVVIDDEQAEIVRYVFTEYNKGRTKKEIAAALNARGERINGKLYIGRTFDRWLTNRKYTGKFSLGKRICTNQYPAIIDEVLFEEVQKRLASNKILAGKFSGRAVFAHGQNLLRALRHCNGCRRWHGQKRQKTLLLCLQAEEQKPLRQIAGK